MNANTTDIKFLQSCFEHEGNQLVVLYGNRECRKEDVIREFLKDKSAFYYRCRDAAAQDQLRMMGEEISRTYGITMQENTYGEYFEQIKNTINGKFVIVVDEAQYVMKKDAAFFEAIAGLKAKVLKPDSVLILLASSSVMWVEQDMKEQLGDDFKKIDHIYKRNDYAFLEVVRTFQALPVSECIKIYGAIGGVPGYMEAWNPRTAFKDNICRLVLTEGGYLFDMAQKMISSELRELSVYNTILAAIAGGNNKLNDLYLYTGFSRAKISVYMKNLSHFDIVEKVVSFETGGWDNAKKAVYQIKDTFINFWFKFVFPNLSDLYRMTPAEFYDRHIANELDTYLTRYFRNVCMEYLMLLNQLGRVPFEIHKMGTWVGKTGNIDIIAQSSDRQNIVGLCNWDKPQLTMQMCEDMYEHMQQARIKSDHYYLFSAKAFEPALVEYVKTDDRFELIDMTEL